MALPLPQPSEPLGLIMHALAFASHKHRDQRRKDAEASPYINHPIALANILTNEGGVRDPIVICAALLHDTIEDTETTADELRATFGEEITAIVLEVTDDKSLSKAERKRLQVVHAITASEKAKLVKLADKISNLRDITLSAPVGWEIERIREYFDWAKAVIDQIRPQILHAHAGLVAAFDAAYAKKP